LTVADTPLHQKPRSMANKPPQHIARLNKQEFYAACDQLNGSPWTRFLLAAEILDVAFMAAITPILRSISMLLRHQCLVPPKYLAPFLNDLRCPCPCCLSCSRSPGRVRYKVNRSDHPLNSTCELFIFCILVAADPCRLLKTRRS